MAKVWLNHLELMGGSLPECCVVCGCEEEIEYLDRELEYRPNWPLAFLGLHFIGWHLIGGFLGWFSERYKHERFTRLPYCPDHYGYWEHRDRRQHLGILIIALGWLIPMIVLFIQNNRVQFSANALTVAIGATVLGLIVIYSLGFRVIHVSKVETTRTRLSDVHPDFVDAVEKRRNP
jgi:hypothetical protein